jgi:catechol 2,3-dioxygenase-like lactoylglutathione lyase family enzyme
MNSDRFDHIFIEPYDFDASLAFYRDSLGWKVAFSWGESGSPRGAGLSSGQMMVVLAEDHPTEDKSKSHGINGNRPTVHLIVEDIEVRYQEVARSGQALFPPQANHWGTRWFVAKDPDGNLIAFEQRSSP